MPIDRRRFLATTTMGTALAAGPWSLRKARAEWSGGGIRSLGESLLGAPKYGDDFPHFDYVNPSAPKGGTVRLSETGRFDSFNIFIRSGDPSAGVSLIYDSLMDSSLDEGSTHYGLLAEWMERPADNSWVAFKLRDGARWHDGVEITVADVQASFELLTTQGAPFFAAYYANVSDVVDEGDRIVRFRFDTTGNKELPHIMGQLAILPKHYWEGRAFDEPSLDAPLGSGPYRIGRFQAGRFVEFERVDDYWGAELPVNVGKNNFGTIRYDFFGDRDIAFEAFKAGDVDYWNENSAQRWSQRFDFGAAQDGRVVKAEPVLAGPKRTQGFVFNSRREKFADRRVREAISLAFDFEFTNRAIYFDQYARPNSYFQGTPELMATGLPSEGELALLEPFRADLPEALFTEPFALPTTDGSGNLQRGILRRARRLLEEAGWTVQDGVLKNAAGAAFEIEFLSAQASQEAVLRPFISNLEVLGIQASPRFIDIPQYISRLREYEFDMVIGGWSNSESPGNEQRDFWGTDVAGRPGGRNLAGVRNPIVDSLIETIVFAPDRAALETASRALDRVLLWEHYAVLQLYTPFERIAHWDRFGRPDPLPDRSIGFPLIWWYDEEKAARL